MLDGRNRRSRLRDPCDGGGIAGGSNQDRPCCCGVKSCNGDAPVARNLALTRKGNTVAGLIMGTSASEFIWGYEGDDIIFGLGGDDKILPGTGNNIIDGGDGNDGLDYTTYVPPWYANLRGVEVDLAAGTAHKQYFSYNPNWDPAAHQTDIFFSIENVAGSNYNDYLFGDGGDNKLYGFGGNDGLHGRGGFDHLEGMDGNDLLDGGSGADVLDGGNGVDTADYGSAPSAVNVSLESGKGYWGDSAGDTLYLIENLTGSAFDDSLVGDSNANVLDGGNGADYLKGGGGADTLKGGDGSDTIAYGDSNIGVYVSLYSGAAFNGTATGDKFDSIENLTGSYHGDMLEGDEYVNTLQGLGGDDVLQGYGDADTIDGGDGIDTVIYGGSVLGVTVSLFNGVTHGGERRGRHAHQHRESARLQLRRYFGGQQRRQRARGLGRQRQSQGCRRRRHADRWRGCRPDDRRGRR
jgi:Ca2+-binding RTX toxin-like protein